MDRLQDSLLLPVVIQQIPSLKYPERLLLMSRLEDDSSLCFLKKNKVEEILGRRVDSGSWTPGIWASRAETLEETLEDTGIRGVSLAGPDYPPQLREIFDPPLVLFYRGTLPDYRRPLLAVVGTRYPSGQGRTAAFRLAFEAAAENVGVVSGLARGIDLAAHQGNMAGGGRTVAVLAGGLDAVYPVSHAGTAREILAREGCLVSEYFPGVRPQKYHFPQRNRIISGLSRAVAVVEAPEKSGALITADFAAEQGRDVFVHGCSLRSPAGGGTEGLYFQGVPAIEGFRDILADWRGKELSYQEETEKTPDPRDVDRLRDFSRAPVLAMEEELAGESVFYQGEYFRKGSFRQPERDLF